jgi:CubicO group peptidase (beta-lactamase class C family)
MSAQAQSLNGRLSGLVANRVEGDRSGACVQAARVELNATTQVAMAAHCARFGERSVPLGARFEIGSISKGFVGLLAAEMAARGELRFDEPLSAFLPPGATAPAFEGKPILLADLLTHTGLNEEQEAMVEIIAEEIRARIAIHDDDPLDPTWASRVAGVAADALLDSFELRPRAAGERRWQRD